MLVGATTSKLRAFVSALVLAVPHAGSAQRTGSVAAQRHDEEMIRAARAGSNRAIASHDTLALASVWLPEFWTVSSTNAQSAGRDAARARYAELFASRPDVVYVRQPEKIDVNAAWRQAAEYGQWRGRWTQADGVTRVGGPYFAKWRKVEDRWLLLAEVFVQTSCSGSSYCNVPP